MAPNRPIVVAALCLAVLLAGALCLDSSQEARRKNNGKERDAKSAQKADPPVTTREGDEEEYDMPPKLVRRVEPRYTRAAREAKIEGGVKCSLTIGTDGLAHDIEVTEGLDPGLDANAVQAIRQWKFEPARKNSKPLATHVNVVLTFHLK